MSREVQIVPFAHTKKLRRIRVAAYARVSTGKDAMLHSLAAQVSHYSTFIQSNPEWKFCGVYADEAISGTKNGRENFQRMLTDCREGKLDLILTKSISRFARNTVTLLESVRELKSLGVDVFFEEQNIHSISSDGELMLTLLASFAQAESLSASENMKWRIRKGFEQGELMGLRILYGYDIKKGVIRVDEKEAAIVKALFAGFLNGNSLESMAKGLNASGIPCTLGGKWTSCGVRRILSNEKYTGNALLQKTYINNHIEKKRVINHGELPQYYAEGTHEALVDMDTFSRAQERLAEIHEIVKDRPLPQSSFFTSRIRCCKCGANFIHGTNNGKHVWQCCTYRKKGAAVCNAKQLSEPVLEAATAEALGTDQFDPQLAETRIVRILAHDGNKLEFIMVDGQSVFKDWENPSRSKSWTPEMKEKARQKRKEQINANR